MAQARLDQMSGVGDLVGKSGVLLFEQFIVEVDEETDDPIEVLQGDIVDDPYGRFAVPLNASHPDPKYSLATVVDYRKLEKMGPLHHRVEVIYQILDSGAIGIGRLFGGWSFQGGIRSKTEHLTTDLSESKKRIGHRLAVYRDDDDPDTDTVVDNADGTSTEVIVGEPDDKGFDVETGNFGITLSTVCRFMTQSALRRIPQFAFHTNSNDWHVWQKNQLLITDIRISERQTMDSQESNFAFVWPIDVEILVNLSGWRELDIPSKYADQLSGVIKQVRRGSEPVSETFLIRREVDFFSFFSLIPAPPPL